jgi:mRNA interferase MazF
MGLMQYQIVLVNLDPAPCVILSPNEMNKYLGTIILAPMTSKSRSYPSRVKIKQNNETGWIVLDQVRTIDKKRIIKVLGRLSTHEIKQTKRVLHEMLVE